MSSEKGLDVSKYWGCPSCDLLIKKQVLDFNHKARCPRCKRFLAQPIKSTVEKTLAMSIGGIILFFPSIYMPLMTLNLIGLSQEQSILQSMMSVFYEGHVLVSLTILITCILVPFIKMCILLYVSFAISKNLQLPMLMSSFKLYNTIDEWGMLEIYMLAILVSVVKLEAIADLSFNLGLALFSFLLLITILSSVFLDKEFFWHQLYKMKVNKV